MTVSCRTRLIVMTTGRLSLATDANPINACRVTRAASNIAPRFSSPKESR